MPRAISTGPLVFIIWLMMLFAVGAAVMRGAGCTYNDIVDRDIDAKVARTAGRPIPSGQVGVTTAIGFLGRAAVARACRAAAVELVLGRVGRVVARADCDLSVHEADHGLAAGVSWG